jgi:hypothetical protein
MLHAVPIHISFHCLVFTEGSIWFRGFLQYLLTWLIFYGKELLAPRPTPKLEDHLLSAVHDCVFNIFAATLHIWRPFLHPQPEDAPSLVGRDFTKTEYNYITSVYKMWNDVFLPVISKSKQILRPWQTDKVKLVPWDTDSDEIYFISVAAMMGVVILRLLLNFITTFRGAHIFQKFRKYLQIQGTIMAIQNKFSVQNSQVLGATYRIHLSPGTRDLCASDIIRLTQIAGWTD